MKEFVEWLEENNWNYILKQNKEFSIPREILERYKGIPKEYIEILETFKQCVSPSDKVWFLCEDDYKNNASAYCWNEFELIGLEAAQADNDEIWEKEIKEWWSKHFPFIISLNEGYSFYAIDLSQDVGAIVYGIEPEFEETKKVAENLDEFLKLVTSGKILL